MHQAKPKTSNNFLDYETRYPCKIYLITGKTCNKNTIDTFKNTALKKATRIFIKQEFLK